MLDLVVIGGGISGLGVAREAVKRGLSCVLFERATCSAATSRSSLRIIHGGFRYLQHLDLLRVIESCRDQQRLLKEYPEFVSPLSCLMPLKASGFKSRYPVTAASALYKAIARMSAGASPEAGYRDGAAFEAAVPLLKGLLPHGALYWTDALLADPDAFAQRLKSEVGEGIREETAVESLRPYGDSFEVQVRHGGEVERVVSRAVVNTAGPWLMELGGALFFPRPKWCRAFNVILNRRLEDQYALGFHGQQRLYFLVPRGEVSVLGTEYIPYEGDPGAATVREAEVEAFISSFNDACPAAGLRMSDVADVEVGVLPMRGLREGYPRLYGMERIARDGSYVEVLSTKYTTFQSQARKVIAALS